MLAPFAPHLAEELYERLGHNSGLFDSATWPEYDETKTVDDSVEVAVQVNGKMRGRINIVAGADEDAVVAAASGVENVARHLDGKTVRKIVHVPDRLLNIVVSS